MNKIKKYLLKKLKLLIEKPNYYVYLFFLFLFLLIGDSSLMMFYLSVIAIRATVQLNEMESELRKNREFYSFMIEALTENRT